MSIYDFLTMRQELMLTITAVLVLIIDLNLKPAGKHKIINVAIGLFLVHLLIGFLPSEDGVFFG